MEGAESTPDLLEIYRSQAPKYDLLVSREDYQGNLLPSIVKITQLHGKGVVEFEAGTGRITRLLAPLVDSVLAFDASEAMLEVAARRLAELKLSNWSLKIGDHRHVQAPTGMADVAISGWSICCVAVYCGEGWKRELDAALAEMKRVVARDGVIVIIETLGTGFRLPHPPDALLGYYDLLAEKGFHTTWLRTDYRFESYDEAVDLATFFFGSEPVGAIQRSEDGIVLPECTGIWWTAADTI
jgi:ubiquinone/menaquinone biosynthesis C-methylase UbiE